jgi:hypothetical protein
MSAYRSCRHPSIWRCWWCFRTACSVGLPIGWQQLRLEHAGGSRLSTVVCSQSCATAELRLPGIHLAAAGAPTRVEVA